MFFAKIKQKKNSFTLEQTGKFFAYLMILPAVYGFVMFTLIPDVSGLAHAFMDDYSKKFTLGYFKYVFISLRDTGSADSLYVCFKNTCMYFFVGLAIVPMSLLLTYFLFKRIWGHNIFRVVFFLPGIINGLVWVTAYKEITSINGVLGQYMQYIGKPLDQSIYKSASTANAALAIYQLWLGLPGQMLFYFSALSRIPDSVFEAAKIDGVTPLKEAFNIAFPLIAPTVGTMLLLQVAGFLGCSGPILLFISDGLQGISTLSFRLYYSVLQDPMGGIGVVSATGIVMTLISLPLTLIVRFINNKYLPAYEY